MQSRERVAQLKETVRVNVLTGLQLSKPAHPSRSASGAWVNPAFRHRNWFKAACYMALSREGWKSLMLVFTVYMISHLLTRLKIRHVAC